MGPVTRHAGGTQQHHSTVRPVEPTGARATPWAPVGVSRDEVCRGGTLLTNVLFRAFQDAAHARGQACPAPLRRARCED